MPVSHDELIRHAREQVGEFSLRASLTAGSVAAALETASGKIYTGVCLDLWCGIGFCAEHAAVAEMLKSRETSIAQVVAVSSERVVPPCGRCRELMLQINARNSETTVILATDRSLRLIDLMPECWINDGGTER
jgi:cytidine deaminase